MGPTKTGTALVVLSKLLDRLCAVMLGTKSMYHNVVYAIHATSAYTDTSSVARRSRSRISERRVCRFWMSCDSRAKACS